MCQCILMFLNVVCPFCNQARTSFSPVQSRWPLLLVYLSYFTIKTFNKLKAYGAAKKKNHCLKGELEQSDNTKHTSPPQPHPYTRRCVYLELVWWRRMVVLVSTDPLWPQTVDNVRGSIEWLVNRVVNTECLGGEARSNQHASPSPWQSRRTKRQDRVRRKLLNNKTSQGAPFYSSSLKSCPSPPLADDALYNQAGSISVF
jgi:hypothetical protein